MEGRNLMHTAPTLSASALVIALALTLVGCSPSSEEGEHASTVEETRPLNTEVCNASSWIREHAPAGLCTSTLDEDEDEGMKSLRLHSERRQ
jgi:hypothetical protein